LEAGKAAAFRLTNPPISGSDQDLATGSRIKRRMPLQPAVLPATVRSPLVRRKAAAIDRRDFGVDLQYPLLAMAAFGASSHFPLTDSAKVVAQADKDEQAMHYPLPGPQLLSPG
jgi:hypothetical protein